MPDPKYVHEKMFNALSCLCDDSCFQTRLTNASEVLCVLEDKDLDKPLANDLSYILYLTKKNLKNGEIRDEIDEISRHQLIEKMLHVFAETAKENL